MVASVDWDDDLEEPPPPPLPPALALDRDVLDFIRHQLSTPPWWHSRALCRAVNTDVFFSDDPNEAKQVCGECPVIAPCLAAALAEDDNPMGVWGNTTFAERAAMRRGPAPAPPSKVDLERRRRRRLASTLIGEGATLADIAKRLRVKPAQALQYLSKAQRALLVTR